MHGIKLFKYSKNRFPFPSQGAGTSECALIEILTTRTSRQLKEVSQAYYTGARAICLCDPGLHTEEPPRLSPETHRALLHKAFRSGRV